MDMRPQRYGTAALWQYGIATARQRNNTIMRYRGAELMLKSKNHNQYHAVEIDVIQIVTILAVTRSE